MLLSWTTRFQWREYRPYSLMEAGSKWSRKKTIQKEHIVAILPITRVNKGKGQKLSIELVSYEKLFDNIIWHIILLKTGGQNISTNYSLWIYGLCKNQEKISFSSRWKEHYHLFIWLWPRVWSSINSNFLISKLELLYCDGWENIIQRFM